MAKKKRPQVSAKRHAAEHKDEEQQPKKVAENELRFILDPIDEEMSVSKYKIWYSECGKYRVTRCESNYGGSDTKFSAEHKRIAHRKVIGPDGQKFLPKDEAYEMWDFVQFDLTLGEGTTSYGQFWRSLRGAAEACVLHAKKFSANNVDLLIAHNEKTGLAQATTTGDDEIRKGRRRGSDKIEKEVTYTPKSQELKDAIGSNENVPSVKKEKQRREPKESASGGAKDRFGYREGTKRARMHATVTNEYQSIVTMAKQAGVPEGKMRRRLEALAIEGHVTEKDSKYKLADK